MGGSGEAAPLFSQMGLAGIIEFLVGSSSQRGSLQVMWRLLLAEKWPSRFFQRHFPKGFLAHFEYGRAGCLLLLRFLYIASRGAVVWGIDRAYRPRRRPR